MAILVLGRLTAFAIMLYPGPNVRERDWRLVMPGPRRRRRLAGGVGSPRLLDGALPLVEQGMGLARLGDRDIRSMSRRARVTAPIRAGSVTRAPA